MAARLHRNDDDDDEDPSIMMDCGYVFHQKKRCFVICECANVVWWYGISTQPHINFTICTLSRWPRPDFDFVLSICSFPNVVVSFPISTHLWFVLSNENDARCTHSRIQNWFVFCCLETDDEGSYWVTHTFFFFHFTCGKDFRVKCAKKKVQGFRCVVVLPTISSRIRIRKHWISNANEDGLYFRSLDLVIVGVWESKTTNAFYKECRFERIIAMRVNMRR